MSKGSLKTARIALVAGFTVLTLVPSALGTVIDPGSGITGQSVFTDGNGITYTASGGTFTYESKCAGCPFGVGVYGGGPDVNGNEVNLPESMTITFSSPIVIQSLIIGYLYPGGIWDESDEKVSIGFDDSFMSITATGATTAVLSNSPGWVVNLDPAEFGFGGAWQIYFPFGNTPVTTITMLSAQGVGASFDAPGCSNTPNTVCSDFTLNGLEAVPEPGAMVLLGTGLLSLAAFKARRRRR